MPWPRLQLKPLGAYALSAGYGLAYVLLLLLAGLYWRYLVHSQGSGEALALAAAALPLLPAVGHLLAPRSQWGGRPYGLLAGVWLGAALFGLLAHWRALDPATPWLSLLRYALLALALLLCAIGHVVRRSCFQREPDPRFLRRPRWLRLVLQFTVVPLTAVALALPFCVTPYRVALAPPPPHATLRRLPNFPESCRVAWFAWSPDSRRLVVDVQIDRKGRVWVVDTVSGRGGEVADSATLSPDRPWRPDGAGFYYAVHEGREAGLWFADAEGKHRRRLLAGEHFGSPTCSPDGTALAYGHDDAVWLARPDGSGARRLTPDTTLIRWSPDGRYLLLGPVRGIDSGYKIVTPAGDVRPLTSLRATLPGPVWLTATTLVTSDTRPAGLLPDLFIRDITSVQVHDLEGKVVKEQRFPSLFSLGIDSPRPSPDGRRLALSIGGPGPMLPQDSLGLLDLSSGRLTRLRTGDPVFRAAWSPDGRRLAFDSFRSTGSEDDTDRRTYLAIVDGL